MSGFFDRLAPQPSLRRRDVYTGLKWVFWDGIFAQGMETLAIGPLMVAYALHFGASNLLIGVLAAVPHLAQFAQIPGVYLVEHVRKRKTIAVLAAAASRPALLIIAGAAFLPMPEVALGVIVFGYLLRYSLGSFAATSWNSWMRDLVPQAILGRFFANRLAWMTAVGAGVSIGAAAFVDGFAAFWPEKAVFAFSVLLAIGFVSGCLCVYCMAQIPEPAMTSSTGVPPFKTILSQPFRDPNFRKLLYFLGSWNFAVNLAAPFFTVYLLNRLHYDLTIVIFLTVLSQFSNILILRVWGRIADRFSNKSVLSVAAPVFLVCIFAWTLTTLPEKHAFTFPLLIAIHVLTGFATAGVTLASGNIGLKLAPSGQGAAYLTASSLTTSLAAALAPILGGLFVDTFAAKELSLTLRWASESQLVAFDALSIRHWDFFFLFASLLGLYSIHRLALVREVGEVKERIVVHELLTETRRSIRTFSTAAGLRAVGDFPLGLFHRERRRKTVRGNDDPAPKSSRSK